MKRLKIKDLGSVYFIHMKEVCYREAINIVQKLHIRVLIYIKKNSFIIWCILCAYEPGGFRPVSVQSQACLGFLAKDTYLQRSENKCAYQTARMWSLIFAFNVRVGLQQVFLW